MAGSLSGDHTGPSDIVSGDWRRLHRKTDSSEFINQRHNPYLRRQCFLVYQNVFSVQSKFIRPSHVATWRLGFKLGLDARDDSSNP